MKNFTTKIISGSLLLILVLTVLTPSLASAQGTSQNIKYIPLEPSFLNLTATEATQGINFATYISKLFNTVFGLAVIFAVLMIVWGGVEYMSTDAIGKKEDGKTRWTNAIWGLLLVMSSYLILQTINPDILTFSGIENLRLAEPLPKIYLESTSSAARGEISKKVNDRIETLTAKENAGTGLTPEEEQERHELEIIRQGTIAMNRIELSQININAVLAEASGFGNRAEVARASIEQLRIEVNNKIAAMAEAGATVEQMATVRRKFTTAAALVERCIADRTECN